MRLSCGDFRLLFPAGSTRPSFSSPMYQNRRQKSQSYQSPESVRTVTRHTYTPHKAIQRLSVPPTYGRTTPYPSPLVQQRRESVRRSSREPLPKTSSSPVRTSMSSWHSNHNRDLQRLSQSLSCALGQQPLAAISTILKALQLTAAARRPFVSKECDASSLLRNFNINMVCAAGTKSLLQSPSSTCAVAQKQAPLCPEPQGTTV